ncbi:MAG: hypothetical protein C5B51_10200 [Terriglobia bacterium]|nr:MAG: hypothetical protein C5B51_10200 [Terriglobia bacterium]
MTFRNRLLQILLLLLRLGVGGIFVYAAWTKLRDPWTLFAISIDAYHVLPQWAVLVVARTLPWLELALGIVLVSGFWRRTSTLAASALLTFFFALMVRAYVRGETIDCGCFGPGEAISPLTLLRDGALLGGSVFMAVMAWRRPRQAGTLRREAQQISETVVTAPPRD